jgi:hypothetical protein
MVVVFRIAGDGSNWRGELGGEKLTVVLERKGEHRPSDGEA